MVYGTNISATYMVGGTGDENQLYGSIGPELSRQSIFTRARYDLTPNLTVWGQVIGIHSYNFSPGVPNYDNNTLTMRQDNPFIPAALRTMMTAQGVTQFTFGRIDPEIGLGAIARPRARHARECGLERQDIRRLELGCHRAASTPANDKFQYENHRNNALWNLASTPSPIPRQAAWRASPSARRFAAPR